ncbi:unnamed protein product [Bursaphelenchus xylophilus]|uniref:(pine wood nematode) hypothetical protein n=1 Tax=Bursaphelenchus xylophilus TaxID=6326 RepID=A0A1I7SDA7_BURXY|nr:unnamed protein product [Bursaphelenchus xylophilus]CAG9130565.1 unnamed protein product [Bursaphelenchus xylophilus]
MMFEWSFHQEYKQNGLPSTGISSKALSISRTPSRKMLFERIGNLFGFIDAETSRLVRYNNCPISSGEIRISVRVILPGELITNDGSTLPLHPLLIPYGPL